MIANLIICGVDNNRARVNVARYALVRNLPVIFTAVSLDGNNGYIFVQEPGKACFGCLFPDAVSDERTPCPNTPAIKDILKVVSGFVLYLADSVLMRRPRNWNYRMIYLSGFAPDERRMIERNPECPLCGTPKEVVVTHEQP